MDNNTDEQKQRQQDLKTASTWLADAREWAKLAKQLHAETEPLPNNDPAAPNKLNVAHSCIANAFQLTYNALLVAEAKWPRENDNLDEIAHEDSRNDTQNEFRPSLQRRIQRHRQPARKTWTTTATITWHHRANTIPTPL